MFGKMYFSTKSVITKLKINDDTYIYKTPQLQTLYLRVLSLHQQNNHKYENMSVPFKFMEYSNKVVRQQK